MRYPTLCVLAERKCAHRGVGAYYGGAPSALSATRAPVQCKSSDAREPARLVVEGQINVIFRYGLGGDRRTNLWWIQGKK